MQAESRQTIAIIPAAGSGVRMGGVCKALLEIDGLSLVERSLMNIAASGLISRVLICVRDPDRRDFEALRLDRRYFDCQVDLVPGGEVRQASVRNALERLREDGAADEALLVLVHDAARCLVSSNLVRRCIDAAREFGAVTAAIPLVDSLKRAGSDLEVQESVPRENIWCVQTPQVFKFDLLYAAHRKSPCGSATDDASLVERLHAVRIVPGERLNFKVTTQEDLELARAVLVAGTEICPSGSCEAAARLS